MSIFDEIGKWLGRRQDPPADPPAEADDDREGAADEVDEVEARERRPRVTTADDVHLDRGLRARLAAGDFDGMLAWLGEEGGVLLARHEATSLPCLCVRCLRPDVTSVEAAGIAFVRDFAVSRRRVLFYWTPVELAGDAERVRRSMRSAIRARLRDSAKGEPLPREGVNPFTKERMLIIPAGRRVPRNPFKKPST